MNIADRLEEYADLQIDAYGKRLLKQAAEYLRNQDKYALQLREERNELMGIAFDFYLCVDQMTRNNEKKFFCIEWKEVMKRFEERRMK